MKRIAKGLAVLLVGASSLLAGGPDSSFEVTPEFGGENLLKIGYQTYKMDIEGTTVQDFLDANDFYLGSKFSLMSDDFAETYMTWKVGFTLNDSKDQDDIFHAGINLGYSSIVSDEKENVGYFMQVGTEYFDGSGSETLYNADVGINYRTDNNIYITPFVGMISDDNFDEIKGEGGIILSYKFNDNMGASAKYVYNKYQRTVGIQFTYMFE